MADFSNSLDLSTAAGIIAFIALVSWPLFRERRAILVVQLCAGIGFSLHYTFLGVAAAATVNVLGCVQTFAAIFSEESPAVRRLGYGLIGLMILAGVYFWAGPVSSLSVTAMVLIALGRLQSDPMKLRILAMTGGGFWMAHDFIVNSMIAFAADTASLAIAIFTFARLSLPAKAMHSAPAPS